MPSSRGPFITRRLRFKAGTVVCHGALGRVNPTVRRALLQLKRIGELSCMRQGIPCWLAYTRHQRPAPPSVPYFS